MRNDINMEPDGGSTRGRRPEEMDRKGDTLGYRLQEADRRGGMPAGLEEKIMAGVRLKARRLRMAAVALSLLAGLAGGAILLAAAYAVLSFAGVGAEGIFSAAERIFTSAAEGLAVLATPIGQAAGFALLTAVFYLSLNGAINSHAKRKALESITKAT